MTRIPLPQILDEETKRQRLVRMQRIATGLLVFAAAVFAVSHALEPRHAWLAVVRGTAEAAMIGAMADWFAVTALFRRPLGLPIPHTAIVPMRKDRIGRSLGGFVQNNFLSRELIAAKLAELGASRHVADWLRQPDNARTITRQAASALSVGVQVLGDGDVQPLLDEALTLVGRMVHDHDEVIRTRIREESPWWVPDRVEDRIHDRIVNAIERTIDEVRVDRAHPLRLRFDAAVRDVVDRMREMPEVTPDANAMTLQNGGAAAVPTLGPVERGIVSLGQALHDDPELIARLDEWILEAVSHVVDQYRGEVGRFIAEIVDRWDANEASRKIELAVGRDLQFIRINGTIMGAIVGLLLFLVQRL